MVPARSNGRREKEKAGASNSNGDTAGSSPKTQMFGQDYTPSFIGIYRQLTVARGWVWGCLGEHKIRQESRVTAGWPGEGVQWERSKRK